jgi:hypothetical protein
MLAESTPSIWLMAASRSPITPVLAPSSTITILPFSTRCTSVSGSSRMPARTASTRAGRAETTALDM